MLSGHISGLRLTGDLILLCSERNLQLSCLPTQITYSRLAIKNFPFELIAFTLEPAYLTLASLELGLQTGHFLLEALEHISQSGNFCFGLFQLRSGFARISRRFLGHQRRSPQQTCQ